MANDRFSKLPRELRDQIYAYLLDAEYLRLKRTCHSKQGPTKMPEHKPVKAYHFYTNILAVNRTIHCEAEELLYQRNTFIVTSYQFYGMGAMMGGLIWAPIVTSVHAARMKHHSLRIHVSKNPNSLQLYHEAGGQGSSIPMFACVLLAQDLNTFCTALETPFATCGGPIVVVNTDLTSPHAITLRENKQTPPSLKIELRDTRFRASDCQLQHRLLSPFFRIRSASMRTLVSGNVHDIEQIQALKATTNLASLKSLANAAVLEDGPEFAAYLYGLIYEEVQIILRTDRLQFVLQCGPETLERFCLIGLDVLLSCGWCHLKLCKFRTAVLIMDLIMQHTNLCAQFHDLFMLSNAAQMHCSHYMFLASLYNKNDTFMAPVSFLEDDLRTFNVEPNPHQAHDRQILKCFSTRDQILTLRHLPLAESSITKLPILCGSHYESSSCSAVPSRFAGWQNIELLRSLDAGKKAQIKALQIEQRIPITVFD